MSKITATTEKSSAVGNAAALREALQSCLDTICRIVWIDDPEYDEDGHYLGANYAAVSRDKARAALAASPRQCDVGTAEEQAERFYNFCTEHSSAIHGMCNYNCPCIDSVDKCHCLCKWSQMPYEEGGGK